MTDETLDAFMTNGGMPPDKPVVQKLNYSHSAMVDLIISNPGIHQNAIAARFGYSASWVSLVINSDAFQAKLAERAAEIIDPALKLTVQERFKGIVARSQEILMERLSKDDVPDNLALRALEVSSRALGYGARDPNPQNTQVNVNVHLEELGDNLTQLLRRRKAQTLEQELENAKG